MGNKIKIEKVDNSNIIGGNVSGHVTNTPTTPSKDSNSDDKIFDLSKIIEKSISKTGIVLMTVFVLSLITLFVITR